MPTNPCILVINDTQEVLDLFADLLTEEGYDVALYSYAIRDMTEIERVQPDLIIVDCLFNEERTGWQFIQKLKMRRTTAAIPIVVCTAARAAVRELEGHLQARGIAVVLKPFNIDDLLQAVEQALRPPQRTAPQPDPLLNGGVRQPS